jgi:hypothetical protein
MFLIISLYAILGLVRAKRFLSYSCCTEGLPLTDGVGISLAGLGILLLRGGDTPPTKLLVAADMRGGETPLQQDANAQENDADSNN